MSAPIPLQPIQSPLQLDTIPQIMYGNGHTMPRHMDVADEMVKGAILGWLLGALIARRTRGQKHPQPLH